MAERRLTADRSSGPGPGDRLEVTVDKAVYRGLGLARHEGQVVFVPRGLPGERVRARVESVKRGYVRARVDAVLDSAPQRRPSPCPYFPRCGGCAYQHADYPAQLAMKEAILRESLERAGVPWAGEMKVWGSPEAGWRTRASFHVDAGPHGIRLGLHEEGTHRVVDLPYCLQVSEAMNRAARGLRAALESRYPAAVRIRGVELAESLDGGRLVAALDTSLAMPEVARLASLVEAAPGLSGLGVVVSGTARGSYVGLRGEPFVEAVVLGTRLRSHVMSFFQANRFLVGDLVRAVAELTPQGGTLLDLYAGVGLFSLCLAHRAGRVSGIESNDFAFEDARANAADAAADNVRFFHGDVLATLRELPPTEDERVILDPPRTGAGPGVVAAVASRRPAAVVYVSCDPPTLGRDLKLFADAGYRPDSVEAFDLFPDTFHLESVVRLARA